MKHDETSWMQAERLADAKERDYMETQIKLLSKELKEAKGLCLNVGRQYEERDSRLSQS